MSASSSTICLARNTSKSLLKAATNNSRSSSLSPCRLVRRNMVSSSLKHAANKNSIGSRNLNNKSLLNSRCTPQAKLPKIRNYSSNNNPSSSVASSTNGSLVGKALKYSLAVGLGTSAGLFTGYYLMLDQYKLVYHDRNQASRSFLPEDFHPTRSIEYTDSPYRDFPLKIHVYQYESCPYCAQVRAYLDYFGFSYTLTEVDAYEKAELTAFTKARMLPIVVIEDRVSKQRWHLVNATAIVSALESLRNEPQHINHVAVIEKFLPIMKQGNQNLAKHPHKYLVVNSELNSIDWRKWINNEAIPVMRLNSVATYRDLRETFDFYAEKSGWRLRYNELKFLYVYYKKMFRAYNSRSALIKSLEASDSKKTPREILNNTIEKWESGLGENLFISGTNKPNLADLNMFGSVKAFEGCALFRESIAKHPLFRQWYERMQFVVTKRYQHELDSSKAKKSPNDLFFPLISLDPNEAQRLLAEAAEEARKSATSLNSLKMDLTQAEVFRVLSVTYLVHLVVFTYAAWMGR